MYSRMEQLLYSRMQISSTSYRGRKTGPLSGSLEGSYCLFHVNIKSISKVHCIIVCSFNIPRGCRRGSYSCCMSFCKLYSCGGICVHSRACNINHSCGVCGRSPSCYSCVAGLPRFSFNSRGACSLCNFFKHCIRVDSGPSNITIGTLAA